MLHASMLQQMPKAGVLGAPHQWYATTPICKQHVGPHFICFRQISPMAHHCALPGARGCSLMGWGPTNGLWYCQKTRLISHSLILKYIKLCSASAFFFLVFPSVKNISPYDLNISHSSCQFRLTCSKKPFLIIKSSLLGAGSGRQDCFNSCKACVIRQDFLFTHHSLLELYPCSMQMLQKAAEPATP